MSYYVDSHFKKAVETRTGLTAKYMTDTPVDQLRKDNETRHCGVKLAFTSMFPLIGRHIIMGLPTTQQINSEVDRAIR